MKKLLALLLALVMVLGMLAGCSNDKDISGNISALEDEEDEVVIEEEPEEEPDEEPEEAPEEEIPEEPAEEPAEEPEVEVEAPAENVELLGRMEGGVYTNTYAGFGCTLDTSWVYYSAEELQELPEDTAELLAETEAGELTSGLTQISDMMAENAEAMASVNVLYTQIPSNERLTYLIMSEEEVIDNMLQYQKDMMISSYEQIGYENVAMEKVTVTFLGEEHTALRTTATLQGYDYYILQILDYTRGSYGVTLTASCFFEDMTEDILALFYKV